MKRYTEQETLIKNFVFESIRDIRQNYRGIIHQKKCKEICFGHINKVSLHFLEKSGIFYGTIIQDRFGKTMRGVVLDLEGNYEEILKSNPEQRYNLTFYINGGSPKSSLEILCVEKDEDDKPRPYEKPTLRRIGRKIPKK